MFRRMYKAPDSAAGKTGGINSVCNIFDRNEKSEPVPDGEEVRIFPIWWRQQNSIAELPLRETGNS